MQLPYTVTFNQPAINLPNGEIKSFETMTIDNLKIIMIIDEVENKRCYVSFDLTQLPLMLWTNEDYDSVGDYTQAQVEARVLELLGDDPKSVLESLFNR